ncbi:MAG: DoxX family protein [Gordonia sp. (in: high G+C Gram-positive bacteria)]|uniref:DoxX family protein n=1 Tax=Gordonia sp. (in: high G+C Gram-positive bacteria) TaxID=84139 RepID=UPI0039E4BAAC
MNTALWIAAWVLAAIFLFAGLAKIFTPQAKLVGAGMGWAEDADPIGIKILGLLELLGAIGLVVPALADKHTCLVPWAAVGLGLTMVGAIIVHLRRKETPNIGVNLVLLALAVFVAWGRFGAHAF